MVGFKWSLDVAKALVAASVFGAVVGVGCGPAAEDSLTCSEAIADDIGNLEYGVIGTTIDDLGMPIPAAKVFIPGTEVELLTDANGRFAIAAEELGGETDVSIWVEKEGYPDKVQVVEIPSDHIADLILVMKPFTSSDVIDAQEGGTVTDGKAYVTFETDSLMYAENGELVTGPVEISVVTYASYRVEDMKAMPGSLYGVTPERDEEGNVVSSRTEPIRTYGFVDVTMYQDGERLELVPGKPAHVVLENIVEGEHSDDLVQQFNDENRDFLDGYVEPTIPLWHFNYTNANWDLVEGYTWSIETGSEGGYLTLSADVPEFSPANPDLPPRICTNSIDVVEPNETCVCRNVRHVNDVEPVRGSDISLLSRARAYTYLVRSCNDGTSTRTLVNTTWVTWFVRTQTDQQGDFCGQAIIDPFTNEGSVRIDSTKTYWPGRLSFEDQQYKDYDGDHNPDDDGDGVWDAENVIGFLGDTYVDVWNRSLSGVLACGNPDGVLHVRCVNEPTDPTTGLQPE